MKRSLVLTLTILIFIPFYGSAWATTDLATLGSPDVTISPSSGPPGTTITIKVSNLPDISKQAYPYPELYIYLPFSKPFGVTVPSHCGGEDCFPIYTHDDALKQNSGDRIITFSLFSTNNPSPVILNGYENTQCDVVVNGKTVERYSTLCNTKDEPEGTYQINLVWKLETNLEESFTTKSVQFAVTPGSPPLSPEVAENGNTVVKQYQDGKINGTEFISKLRAIGWNDEQIRQALAVIGKLPHQMGGTGPDNTQQILEQVSGPIQNTVKTNSEIDTTQPKLPTAGSTTVSTKPEAVLTTEQTIVPPTPDTTSDQNNLQPLLAQNSSSWNNVVIALAIGIAGAIAGIVFFMKITQKATH